MRYTKENKIYTINDIRKLNTNISIPFGSDLSFLGYDALIETEMPIKEGHIAMEDGVINNTLQWKLIPIIENTPDFITKLQAMKILKERNLWESVKAILASNEEANEEWMLSSELNRHYPLIQNMAEVLSLSDDDLDDIFIKASKL